MHYSPKQELFKPIAYFDFGDALHRLGRALVKPYTLLTSGDTLQLVGRASIEPCTDFNTSSDTL